MSRLSMDLKVMQRSQKGHWYVLCIIDEVTNYLITAPLYQTRSEEVEEVLIESVISKFSHSRLYNDGPGQCIHVLLNELFVQKVRSESYISRTT